ncbi:XRN 5'-3' exonuclease N-terminus-domain-containing protein [Fomitopsis serialis]|uniref:XRN 5'-3' exonuclease N-terminus-domain-containing protein n=1 Tax=Fomitopsis serialis TaxID=139415 RepID=UPI0020079DF3|nr:XRN 5'-3' exonuclease N-terminus-domain-containing protein [Neoantrodia serialis]KAH9938476.1 XRN 5'-3' exonuclease N-terminus-domain-containing protein [Neoantrodia serialis]
MGVPALFRWLSKKYPKIILPVVEEDEVKVPDGDGNEVAVPVDMSRPNPNEVEFDNLYLDMNGIVHPCTHPEGKPAPETEEEMMLEVFKYTERVVNMVRPRKLLFMAIDGVAPRAKMNQQRSRRFRSAQEAKEKEEARKESVAMWEAMGKTLSEEEKNKKSWDSNAITPGTPFMDLLANALRYWVVQKMNTDPGWKEVQVIISDAGVPGEGEHKIMDFIRRQRSNPGHDPNTRHVIYGLDADLIMLSLATHEPHFRVLREDVFSQSGSATACRICGQEGHYAAQCTGTKAEVEKKPVEKKPFIFLDVAILREYLEAELRVSNAPFPFNLEQAIDDWVFLIFFVGNDFLPHLPSLEIREGAIDTLLKIWREELPRMGGYLTNHGQVELSRAEIILEGLAKREDDIFRRRRESEERQDQNAKRRKIEKDMVLNGTGPSASLNLTATPTAPAAPSTPMHHPLPPKPTNSDSIGLGGPKTSESALHAPTAAQALAGSNRDVVANRRAIRMANMSAAEMLKAELAGLQPLKPKSTKSTTTPAAITKPDTATRATSVSVPAAAPASLPTQPEVKVDEEDVPGLGASASPEFELDPATVPNSETLAQSDEMDADGIPDSSVQSEEFAMSVDDDGPRGTKRSIDEAEADEEPEGLGDDDDEDEAPASTSLTLKVNPDGTVEQEDVVKLWEPGYKERYYRQKFGVEHNDAKFKKDITTRYMEGLAWVLQYYYQGTPSWTWYYPYHFAPFAADFEDIRTMNMDFNLGQPFKPFEQLMGVFPAASRQHIPEAFQHLMTEETSPIIDFYPPSFQVDMNGKRMLWQGVALLPFIDEKRLLDAMADHYSKITDDEKRRNRWGNDVLFVFEEHPLYTSLEALYGKRNKDEIHLQPMPINVDASKGISGSLLPNPDCIPGSHYYSPFATVDLPDIKGDRSLSAVYLFPKQLTPHRSVLLPGVRRPRPILTEETGNPRNGAAAVADGADMITVLLCVGHPMVPMAVAVTMVDATTTATGLRIANNRTKATVILEHVVQLSHNSRGTTLAGTTLAGILSMATGPPEAEVGLGAVAGTNRVIRMGDPTATVEATEQRTAEAAVLEAAAVSVVVEEDTEGTGEAVAAVVEDMAVMAAAAVLLLRAATPEEAMGYGGGGGGYGGAPQNGYDSYGGGGGYNARGNGYNSRGRGRGY